ncbi:MAG: hypothetical protein EU517_01400 [Promethearchaeota archaeon]|nr:MAG: hypothetical protein EU517_01400 [Candidatus Lokiarchaeota archaeon]
MLGTTGFFLLFTFKMRPSLRLIMGTCLAIFHQFVILQIDTIEIAGIPHGGVFGLLSWFSFATFASLLSDRFIDTNQKIEFGLVGVVFVILGIGLGFFLAFSRQLINLPFLLISLGISILLSLFLYYFFEEVGQEKHVLRKERFFSVLGKNTFFLYILQVFFKLFPYVILPFDTLPLIFFSFGFLMVLMNYGLASFMAKNGIYLII